MPLDKIEDALNVIAQGGMAIVIDGDGRENEGDLVMAAELATPKALAFMIRHTSGVICTALPGDRLSALQLPPMVPDNNEAMHTAFTVSTDYRPGTTTGISAADRALTIRALVDESALAQNFTRPGHVFPLHAVAGGVLQRSGHTEAAVDLSRLAGLRPGGVLCELVNDDGTMARLPELKIFSDRHGLPLISIADLIAYRKRTEMMVHRRAEARLPTRFGDFTAYSYESKLDGLEHVALVMGDVAGSDGVLVRVHSECLTGDVFGSMRCDFGAQLNIALAKVAREGRGVIVYLKGHEGRGIGLTHKLRAYALQDIGRDTVQANLDLGLSVDSRDYTVGAQILADLGVVSMRLMTNNPAKCDSLVNFGLSITASVPLVAEPNKENLGYLWTKQDKLGHILGLQGAVA